LSKTLFTATGCTRCKIAKQFMDERGIPYQEVNIKAGGMSAFRKFYSTNRSSIIRREDGIEFPVLANGKTIRQGVGVVLAYLVGGTRLDGFFSLGELSQGWVDGLHVSGGSPSEADTFIEVLDYLKKKGLRLQFDTNGKNASVLEKLLTRALGDRVIMEVLGPLNLYERMLGEAVDPREIEKSIALVTKFPEYQFYTTIRPVQRPGTGEPKVSYLTPEEITETAALIEKVTGDKKHPYFLRPFDPEKSGDEALRKMEKISPSVMFKYRSAARKHLVLAELEKGVTPIYRIPSA